MSNFVIKNDLQKKGSMPCIWANNVARNPRLPCIAAFSLMASNAFGSFVPQVCPPLEYN